MSKTAKAIIAKPFIEQKVIVKNTKHRMTVVANKVAMQSNPIQDAMRQRMLTGGLYVR